MKARFKELLDILEMVEYDIEQVIQETYYKKSQNRLIWLFNIIYHSGVRKCIPA